ncbi:MAG: hypothetical protein WBB70_08565 [Desulfobacterales bacterium]
MYYKPLSKMALKELYYNLWCLCVFVAERLLDLLFSVCTVYKKEVIKARIWQKPDENDTLIRRGERNYVR